LTSILQPLDVGVNKPIKTMLRIKWAEWMTNGKHAFTKGGRQKAPDMPTIARWVRDVWNELDSGRIVKSFLKCCISNALDGTDDDILWEDDTPFEQLSDEDEDDVEHEDDWYLYDGEGISDEQITKLFMDSDSESEFLGFD